VFSRAVGGRLHHRLKIRSSGFSFQPSAMKTAYHNLCYSLGDVMAMKNELNTDLSSHHLAVDELTSGEQLLPL
jgi:hypothetical protein